LSVSSQTNNRSATASRHWQNLQTLLLCSPSNSDFLLRHPPPEAPHPGLNITQLLQCCSSNKRRLLLIRHLLSSLALFNVPQTEHLLFSPPDDVKDFFPEIGQISFTSASWIAVPIPVVRGSGATVLTMMLGLVTGRGRVLFQNSPCIDQSSRTALQTVFNAPFHHEINKEKDLLVWTLQNEDSTRLKGASLGLPVAIGLYLLQNQKQWPSGFFASGEVTTGGDVRSVKYIREKTAAISRESQLFVVPEQNSHAVNKTKMVYVRTIKEALFAVNCFQADIHDGNSITLFQLAARDPEILLAQFKKLPVEFFRLQDISSALKKIKRTPEKYLAGLASCLRENSYKIDEVHQLASLFTCDDIEQLASSDEYNSLKYCLGLLALHNHSGNIEESQRWSICAGKIETALNRNKERSQLVNNDFVHDRFNRYDFRIDVPDTFINCLKYEIKLHEIQEDDSWRLGAMYGTLAQNYGFCGPKYLGNLREMVQKSLAAFGSEHRNEHSQVKAYLIYGLLDSCKIGEAKSVLQQYLDLPQSPMAQDWCNYLSEIKENRDQYHDYSFKTCVVCRVLAEHQALSGCGKSDFPDIQPLISETLQQTRHPWQLTAINLARLCLHIHKQEQAAYLLNHAVSICMDNGETMQAMALLPLSLFHAHNFARKQQYRQAEQILAMIRSNNMLNQSHFIKILSCQTGQEILEETVKIKLSLFPFSYR